MPNRNQDDHFNSQIAYSLISKSTPNIFAPIAQTFSNMGALTVVKLKHLLKLNFFVKFKV